MIEAFFEIMAYLNLIDKQGNKGFGEMKIQ